MPYSPEHRDRTRERIIRSAQILFNRHGFEDVSIDSVMAHAGLTHGGFYMYFEKKSDLYAAAMKHALKEAPMFHGNCSAADIVRAYLSTEHFEGIDGSCPLCTLPSYVARSGIDVKLAFEAVFKRMVDLFEDRLESDGPRTRDRALAISGLCVGGMAVARAIQDRQLADSLRHAATVFALQLAESSPAPADRDR